MSQAAGSFLARQLRYETSRRDELLIAVAGPLASAAIGLACLAVSRSGLLPPVAAEPIAWVARINLGVPCESLFMMLVSPSTRFLARRTECVP